MENKKISIKVGPPVEGDDFYGREAELQYAWKYHISKGVSLLLSAPRRVGKSSFAKKMIEIAKGYGWKTLYLDVEGISTEAEFVKLFKEGLQSVEWWTKVRKPAMELFESISVEGLELGGVKVSIGSNVWRSSTYGKITRAGY